MKASELMPDDIVLYEYEGQKTPAKVVEIYRDSVLVEDISGEYEPIEINEAKIYPTEITPEILEKNGFCQFWNEDVMLMTRDGVDLEVGNNYKTFEDGRVYLKCIKMYYVHQLQQALRLVGIDKSIEL